MSNFMGPMAPPPAAPAQPQALDFQTDPNQRQRFKQFMQQRMQPPMPQMPAPMPQPMPTVPAGSYILPDMDIFAPQQFYDGGIVGGLNNLGEMSGQMVEALNQVVYGGDPMGGGMPSAPSGPPSMGGGGFGGGNMPPPLPPVDTSVYQPGGSTDSSGPVANIGSGVPTAQPYNHVGASAINTSDMYGGIPGADNSMTMGTGLAADGDVRSAYEAAVKSAQEQRKNGFMGRVMLPGEMGFDRFAEGYNYRLNNPNLQPLTSVGNDGFGSISQGPLDFLDGSNIAQPTLGGNVGGDKLMGVLPNGGVSSGQMPPGFTPLPPGELGFTENMMGPFEAYAGGSKYFDESTGLYTGPESYRNQDPLYKFADGGSVPPRETDIRGMHHELSYITPDEADILMALGGTGEAGPMGIPSYRPGGDDVGSENAGSGDHSGGSDSASGANSGNDGGGGGNDDASDDDMGDVGVMSGPGSSSADFSGEEGDDFSDPDQNYGNDDGSFDANDFADFGVDAAKENAIKSAFVTDTSGKPIGTSSGYVTQGKATDAELAAGYKALGLPDPNSDLASADVEASYGVPVNAIETVSSGVPSNANKSGLLGFNYDLLKANIEKATEAKKGLPTQVSPLPTSPFNARNQAAAKAAPSSNVDPNYSQSTVDQLSNMYGIDYGLLDAAVDDDFASIGNRPGPGVEGPGTGYTDQGLPVGLDFATNPQTGAQITTNLAGLTEQQKANQPFSMDVAQFIGSNPYGYELDPATGNPIGQVGTAPFGILGGLSNFAQNLIMGKPQTVQDLIERGAYTGMTGQDGGDDIFGGGRDDPIIVPPEPEEVVQEPSEPNQIGGINTPADPLAPAGPVLVPSNRTSTPFSGQMPVGYGSPQTGQINPYALSEMKRYQQMLARLNQPRSPIGLAQGGSVLDAAAGRFLESLTAA